MTREDANKLAEATMKRGDLKEVDITNGLLENDFWDIMLKMTFSSVLKAVVGGRKMDLFVKVTENGKDFAISYEDAFFSSTQLKECVHYAIIMF